MGLAHGGSSPSARMSLLRLWSHDLLENRDAVAMGDRQVAKVRLSDADPEQFAVLDEDPPDIGRVVCKEVPDVGVVRDTATGKPRSKAIDNSTPV